MAIERGLDVRVTMMRRSAAEAVDILPGKTGSGSCEKYDVAILEWTGQPGPVATAAVDELAHLALGGGQSKLMLAEWTFSICLPRTGGYYRLGVRTGMDFGTPG